MDNKLCVIVGPVNLIHFYPCIKIRRILVILLPCLPSSTCNFGSLICRLAPFHRRRLPHILDYCGRHQEKEAVLQGQYTCATCRSCEYNLVTLYFSLEFWPLQQHCQLSYCHIGFQLQNNLIFLSTKSCYN